MGLNDDVHRDVIETIECLESQCHSDRITTLRLLLEKYIHKNRATHLMEYRDLHSIIENSKGILANMSLPKSLGYGSLIKEVPQDNLVHLCLVESAIGHLNRIDCFKRVPKFDYK
jgi:hypothetical protein